MEQSSEVSTQQTREQTKGIAYYSTMVFYTMQVSKLVKYEVA